MSSSPNFLQDATFPPNRIATPMRLDRPQSGLRPGFLDLLLSPEWAGAGYPRRHFIEQMPSGRSNCKKNAETGLPPWPQLARSDCWPIWITSLGRGDLGHACASSEGTVMRIPELIKIPAGVLLMGSTRKEIDDALDEWASRLIDPAFNRPMFREWLYKEYPAHPVPLESFSIGRYPVTNAEYSHYVRCEDKKSPESLLLGEPWNHPVWGVTLEEARDYANWIGGLFGMKCRLPSEAEWEYAARGPSRRTYPFGVQFDPRCCNTLEADIGGTTPVDTFAHYPSEFGVCDLAGNVEEWTASCYRPYPGGIAVVDDLVRHLGKNYPILRGGSFARNGDLARCARRHGPHPGSEYRYTGFRLASSDSR